MDARPLAVLLLAFGAPARAGTTRVELTPELGLPSGPAAGASLVPLQLGAGSLIPLSLSPALPAAASLAPSPVPVALVPVKVAAAVPAGERPLVIKSLSETPALDTSRMGAGESAAATETDFMARAQLGGPSALTASVAAASADFKPVKRGHLTLVHSAKTPAAKPAAAVEGAPLDLVVTPQSLRALTEKGQTRLLIMTPEGRWLLKERESRSAYPTPEELLEHSGSGARLFVASKSGVLEWNSDVEDAAALAAGRLERAALKTGVLAGWALGRLGAASKMTSWRDVERAGLGAGEAPVDERILLERVIPALIAAELPLVAAKLGYELTPERRADALKRSNGYRMYWHSAYTYKDHPDNLGIPDGHFRKDFGVRLMVKPDWRRIKDIPANFRPLYAHEYTHWLQNEGHVSYKYGGEIAAVAVEILRAIELIGYDAVAAGGAATVHAGNWSSFEGGRQWARAGLGEETTPYSKGALAGAAYEAGVAAGRPEAAWEFLRLVIAGDRNPQPALSPAAAWAKVVGPR
ncbi:MAG: hypothetical protein M0D55_08200 [Elusimicrobiota bacterium]|nr:MAG: hypothetical protein M0D55_08200 [Elusimicrobiota bacterium]